MRTREEATSDLVAAIAATKSAGNFAAAAILADLDSKNKAAWAAEDAELARARKAYSARKALWQKHMDTRIR